MENKIKEGIKEIYDVLGFILDNNTYIKAIEVILIDLNINFERDRIACINFRDKQIGFVQADLYLPDLYLAIFCNNDENISTTENRAKTFKKFFNNNIKTWTIISNLVIENEN